LPTLPHHDAQITAIARGGYTVQDCQETPELILIATGSEVQIALEAAQQLSHEGCAVRVISMPCPEQFLAQETSYQEQILPTTVRRRVAIEASSSHYWYRFVGLDGAVVGLDRFGASAPADAIYADVNITVQHTLQIIKTLF
jgi:transketolase